MKKHVHSYDDKGNMTCCSLEEKIDQNSSPPSFLGKIKRPLKSLTSKSEGSEHEEHDHDHTHEGKRSPYIPAIISFVLLISGLAIKYLLSASWFAGWIEFVWFFTAFLPVGIPVLIEAYQALRQGQVFTEFFLMSIATIGAFLIGEYPEAVAVMLFYSVGELFQSAAVKKAKNNITSLLDIRSKIAHVSRNEEWVDIHPEKVSIDEIIQVRAGEKVPLDGLLLSEKASLNTAAITGESKPDTIYRGEKVLAGSINESHIIEIQVEKAFEDSSISKILEMVQHAGARKAKTELLIRKLAKIYTPIVVYLAIGICVIPYFIMSEYVFQDWLYRSLIFLVISCPCALVISIPLGYFGGLGAASKRGILFKGANFLEMLTQANSLVMDKTGTVTKGVFTVQEVKITNEYWDENKFMRLLVSIESQSSHPIAKAIAEYGQNLSKFEIESIEEQAGKGLVGLWDGKQVLVGNQKLLNEHHIEITSELKNIVETTVLMAVDGLFVGYVVIADELKPDAKDFVDKLRKMGIDDIHMLSGDKESYTSEVAKKIGISQFKGGLLPEGKLKEVEKIQTDPNKIVVFVGDGINDAPVLAASHIGIAMGAKGSDVAIETADIVIQTDEPSKIITGIQIGKATKKIIIQNIVLAFGVKLIVLTLGALGYASMWAAVFADVGVALLAILNAIRIQYLIKE